MPAVQTNQVVYLGTFCPSGSLSDSWNNQQSTCWLLAVSSLEASLASQQGFKPALTGSRGRDTETLTRKGSFCKHKVLCLIKWTENSPHTSRLQEEASRVWEPQLPHMRTQLSPNSAPATANTPSQNKAYETWQNVKKQWALKLQGKSAIWRLSIDTPVCFHSHVL